MYIVTVKLTNAPASTKPATSADIAKLKLESGLPCCVVSNLWRIRDSATKVHRLLSTVAEISTLQKTEQRIHITGTG